MDLFDGHQISYNLQCSGRECFHTVAAQVELILDDARFRGFIYRRSGARINAPVTSYAFKIIKDYFPVLELGFRITAPGAAERAAL